MKEQDYYLLDVLKRNRKICISLILIILVGIVFIIAAVALELQAAYQILPNDPSIIDQQIAWSWLAVMITAVITWILILILNIIFVVNNLKIKNHFKEDAGFWVAMSILVFFFSLIIVSISLNKINEYIKTMNANESNNSGENNFIIPFDNKKISILS